MNKSFNDWYDRTRNKVILDTLTTPLWFGKNMKFPIKFRVKSNPDAFKSIKWSGIIKPSDEIGHSDTKDWDIRGGNFTK